MEAAQGSRLLGRSPLTARKGRFLLTNGEVCGILSVSMPTKQPARKTKTNWKALYQAKIWPKEIICQSYYPTHFANVACHSRIIPKVENIKNHMRNCSDDVGLGIYVVMETRSEGCPLWKDLEEAGIEALDFRCAVDNHIVPFHPFHIAKHTKPHSGNRRRVTEGNRFYFTLSYEQPIDEEEEF